MYIQIKVGSNQLSSSSVRYLTKKAIVHEHYDESSNANDLALIQMKVPFEFDERVQPLNLSTKEVAVNTQLSVYGFGQLAVSIFFSLHFLQKFNKTVQIS